jgi:hypothetical protein
MNGMHSRSSCPPNHFLSHEADGGGVAKVVMPLAAHPFNMVVGRFVDWERLALASVPDHDHVPPGIGGHVHRAPGRSHHLTSREPFGRVNLRALAATEPVIVPFEAVLSPAA